MNFCCLIVGSIVEVDGDYSEILFLPALDEQKLKFFLDLYAIYFGFHSVLIFFFFYQIDIRRLWFVKKFSFKNQEAYSCKNE